MRLVKSIKEMQRISLAHKRKGKTIGFVPTMGFLHEGHLSLVKKASRLCDVIVVSIFVNPTQFGPNEDFNRYPRDLKGDLAKLKSVDVDYVFFPSAREMYPEGYQSYVEVEKISKGLCGDFRPGHFRGVATVVAKLFNIVLPDIAIFGEKDFQQLKVIERMVKDLNFPLKVISGRTVRERDGLAMSSRNSYLSAEERNQALCLSRALYAVREKVREGERDVDALVNLARGMIERSSLARIEYIEIRDSETLEPVESMDRASQMLIAVWFGNTRLIDNIWLNPSN